MADQRRIVTAAPENSETPLDSIRSWVTPTRLFFVRSHFDVPTIEAAQWTLHVEGCVRRPLLLRLDDLERLPRHTVFATVECAGNGRSFLRPPEHGVQWGAGAIAHAEWTGVRLAAVLEKAGLRPETQELVFQGADRGQEKGQSEPTAFARSLPLAKALDPDTLLATHMNGEPLEPCHGYPLRLLAPGWYGVASVKWLTRIAAIDHAFQGFYQTDKYTIRRRTERGIERAIVQEMAVKSEVMSPREGDLLRPGVQRVSGVAWAGGNAISRVEVSTDGGLNWHQAALVGPQAAYSWALWEYAWRGAEPGEHTILSRAASTGGQTQPLEHDPLLGGYMINFCRPRRVVVESATPVDILRQAADARTLVYDMNAFAEANAELPLDVEMELIAGAGI